MKKQVEINTLIMERKVGKLYKELGGGALAGLIGGLALAGTAQVLYMLTNPKKIRQEEDIEPRNPFIVLSDKFEENTGITLTHRQKQLLEPFIIQTISASAGMGYVALAKTWNFNWVAGGIIFGTIFWAIEDEALLPALGLVGDIKKYPAGAHIRGLVSHIVFGLVSAAVLEVINVPKDH